MGDYFKELQAVNVNEHTEKKTSGGTTLTYLSWPFAWAEVKKRFPDATYKIERFDGLPYVFDPQTGYMVFTTVTIGGDSHEMWLPVMDSANKAMKAEPYEYQTRTGKKTVEAATMFDINKTIMRCLVKNLAMFGLGLYIYAGEDLPIVEDEPPKPKKATKTEEKAIGQVLTRAEVMDLVRKHYTGEKMAQLFGYYRVTSFDELTEEQLAEAYKSALKKRSK